MPSKDYDKLITKRDNRRTTMSMWDFRNEITQDTKGANTEAGFVAGYQPFYSADTLSSKRNVVATEKGWVRRQNYTDVHGTVRVKEEVIIAAHPGIKDNGGYANSAHLGTPDISILQLDNTTYAVADPVTLYVTFNEPLVTTSNVSIDITRRTAGDGPYTLTSNTTNGTGSVAKFAEYGANNTLVFTLAGGTLSAGQWKVRAQDLVVDAAGTLVSWNVWDGEAANLTVQAPVSNTLMDSTGAVLANGEFTVTA